MLPEFKTILYATDLGPGAPDVFRHALSLACKYDAAIRILHTMEPLSPFGQSLVELHISHQESEQIHAEARKKVATDITQRLEKFSREHAEDFCEGDNPVAGIDVLEGNPAQMIVEHARKIGADLIVMGSHRHSALGEALLGSTAQKVLHYSEVPVLLTRIQNNRDEAGV